MSVRKANEGKLKLSFSARVSENRLYEDSLPEDITLEDLKEEYGKLVWCQFYDCFWNKQPKEVSRTWGSIIGNKNFNPINESESTWTGLCSRPTEIALTFTTIRGISGSKQKVPTCHTSAANGKLGHMDFSKLLQSDGSALGGSIESQNTHDGGQFGIPSGFTPGRERIVNYGGQESKSRPTKEYDV